jgi:N-acetylglucosaminyldiphosphoundecaprenol N-acetyl-beta-D-mannosaminyltransferase
MTNRIPCDFMLGDIKCSTHTIRDLLDEINVLMSDKSLFPRTIMCINAHIYNIACNDDYLRQNLNSARVVCADGMSILPASRLLGTKIIERCNMKEAFRAFLCSKNLSDNVGIIIGNTEDEAKQAAVNIEKLSTHCKIIKAISGFLTDEDYEHIFANLDDLDFIFLGMGTPRSEKICNLASLMCPKAIVWHIGGGTIKIFAGRLKEAPVVWRRIGLQWVHRLCSDPFTLWHRYLVGNPLFMYRIFKLRLKGRKHNTLPRR